MPFKPVLDWLIYVVVRVIVSLLQTIPLATCYAVGQWLGELGYRLDRRRRHVALDNLRRAFPGRYSEDELHRIVRAVFIHFASIVAEIAHIPRLLRQANWWQHLKVRDHERTVELMLSGRPVILMTAHFGNWEVAGYAFGVMGFNPYSVARSLDNPYLERFLREFRTKTGQRIIYKRGAFDQISAVMRQGSIVAFLSDQDAGSRGVFVEFFGRPASSHKGVALLSLEHDAPVCVGFARRLGAGMRYEVWVEAVIDPRDYRGLPDPVWSIIQDCARAVERAVRVAPEQYFWLHRRWKHQPQVQQEPRAA